ncbi:MAG TPA: cupin domain-containing protein [Spirochaetes bacterium]|nr:cupin domain-containing protein [Spirochaetota bacterium]
MTELKYKDYVLTDVKLPDIQQQRSEQYAQRATRILWLEDFVIKGAPSVICSWYWKATDTPGTPAHTHDFDEVLGFLGSDPEHPHELNGEVEMWLGDEMYTLTKSSLVYCPRNLPHCPLRVVRVDKPILFLAFSVSTEYSKKML